MLFGSYRRGDANDPEVYVTAISAVLSLYDTDLVREVTDPRTGIQTTEKYMTFMPNAGELKVYCEGLATHRERMKRYAELPRVKPMAYLEAPETPDGAFAHVFVPKDHSRYPSLVAWSETAQRKYWKFGKASDGRDGIWVAHGVWDPNPTFMSKIGNIAEKVIREAAE